jgi:hypothetical protein
VLFGLKIAIDYGLGQIKESCVIATASEIGIFKLTSGKMIVSAILLII